MLRNHHLCCTLSPSLSSSLLLLLLFFFFFGSFHGVHSAFSTVCDPVSSFSQCGKILIQYPFWTINDADVHCGYPGLGVGCPYGSDYPILSLPGGAYFVTEIDYVDQALTLVDIDVAHQSCPRARHNPTFGSLPLDYNPADVNLTFFFNCSTPPAATPARPIDCLRSGDKQSYVFVDVSPGEAAAFAAALDCKETVVAAVKGTEVMVANVVEELAGAVSQGFVLDWAVAKKCRPCERSGGRCAFDQTQHVQCFCDDGANHSDGSSCKGNNQIGLKVVRGLVGVAAGIGMLMIIYFICKPCPKRIKSDQSAFVSRSISLTHSSRTDFEKGKQRIDGSVGSTKTEGLFSLKKYSYEDMKTMTNSFKEKLGQGGYGSVYKGNLRDGQPVAVKLPKKSKGDHAFRNEVTTISKTSHVNVVSLLGYCLEGSERALVYEFVPNGSLEKFIFNKSDTLEVEKQLSWDTLYQISLGIACGLKYLHYECNTRIVHLDIKPHNVLLDANYCPKISDFGLAKICRGRESIVSMEGPRGTHGYIAPELTMRNLGGVSHKSDVYSYGMMILQMVDKRKKVEIMVDQSSETYLDPFVHRCLKLLEDVGMRGITNKEDQKIAKKMAVIGLRCVQFKPGDRPSMTQVVEMFKGDVDALQVPAKSSLQSLAACPRESLSLTLPESNELSLGNSYSSY